MSAFIVNKTTIDCIVTALVKPAATKTLKRYRMKSESQLGQAIWDMNTDAVNSSYGSPEPYTPYTFREHNASMIQAIKSLNCLLYQCSEGDIPDTELFKMLAEDRNKMLRILVESFEEYKSAEWG
jgi:hypothetical protein